VNPPENFEVNLFVDDETQFLLQKLPTRLPLVQRGTLVYWFFLSSVCEEMRQEGMKACSDSLVDTAKGECRGSRHCCSYIQRREG